MIDKKAFWQLSYGLSIVSSRREQDGAFQYNGQVANAVFQVSSNPPTLGISLNTENLTHDYVLESGLFNVMVLTEDVDMSMVGLFGYKSGHQIDKFASQKLVLGQNGLPIIGEGKSLAAIFECKVISSQLVHTHRVFFGEVTHAEAFEGRAMTYDYYHKVKGMKSPKNAPTYVEESAPIAEATVKIAQPIPTSNTSSKGDAKINVCGVCGFEYKPGENDGIEFGDLPHDWVCPLCGAEKSLFQTQN